MNLSIVIGLWALAFVCVLCDSEWDEDNDPALWSDSFEYKLSRLPQSGYARKKPWSDTYWPSKYGGIARRWQDRANRAPGFNYRLHSRQKLLSGTVNINLLSPAEKYDILKCRYSYPLVRAEWSRCSPRDEEWEGLCHGWAAAAINYDEPIGATMTNCDGIEIPFVSSDVKALLIYFLGEYSQGEEETITISDRCDYDLQQQSSRADRRECADINPGSFHVVSTNVIGVDRLSFVADIDRSAQVWNQPLYGYSYGIRAGGTSREKNIDYTLYYIDEVRASATPLPAKVSTKQYQYTLQLDSNGRITGGSYPRKQWDRLDFIWKSNAPDFYGYFEELGELYESSRPPSSRLLPKELRRRVTMDDYKAAPVTGKNINFVSNANDNSQKSWRIDNTDKTKSLRLKFNALNTRRNTEFVRVYETMDGKIDAPLTFLHGESPPAGTLTARAGAGVMVTFTKAKMAARRVSALNLRSVIPPGFQLEIL